MNAFSSLNSASEMIDRLKNSFAIIELKFDGYILAAKNLLCDGVSYELDEVRGRVFYRFQEVVEPQHSLFINVANAMSPAYPEFWEKLGWRELFSDKFQRVGESGAGRKLIRPSATGKSSEAAGFYLAGGCVALSF